MKRSTVVLALVIAATLLAEGGEREFKRLDGSKITSSSVDQLAARLVTAAEVTGLGITIFDQGKVVYQRTYGVRDKEKGLPLTENSGHDSRIIYQSGFCLHGDAAGR